jgi:hypothetical protein
VNAQAGFGLAVEMQAGLGLDFSIEREGACDSVGQFFAVGMHAIGG